MAVKIGSARIDENGKAHGDEVVHAGCVQHVGGVSPGQYAAVHGRGYSAGIIVHTHPSKHPGRNSASAALSLPGFLVEQAVQKHAGMVARQQRQFIQLAHDLL